MRTTVDLPDNLFREAKSAAAKRGVSLKELMTDALVREVFGHQNTRKRRRQKFPLIPSKEPGTLKLTNEQINEMLL